MTWREVLVANNDRYVEDLLELLRIPSMSAVEASVGQVKRAADWVAARLKRGGIENVEVFPTGKHACVYGDWLHAPGKPTILIYGHFDVQPVDPLNLWDSPPFEPMIKDGKVFARGAADMKGNLLLSLIGAEALLAANGSLPVNVKFVFEGQEEVGSRDLDAFIAANRERLACDLILTADGLQWSGDQPMMVLGTKGLCAVQIDIETASMDLHSGLYGGGVPNADHALVELLSTLRDKDGRILVEGFYDSVIPLSDEERAAIKEVPFDDEAYKSAIGIHDLVGEPGYSTYERTWARPTLEINGVSGGYQGDGVKTVIPAKSQAKITCRLVANQDPDDIYDLIEAHVKRNVPKGAKVTVTKPTTGAQPYLMPQDHPGVQAVADVLHNEYQKTPYYVRLGGSLPITDMFLQRLEAYTVMVGFSQDDERVHSPNEFFRLDNYARGQAVYAMLLERFASVDAKSLAVK
jgi:acetylornithine deacetylase/succinyl-diaminopimelate desuccinylase-like protein